VEGRGWVHAEDLQVGDAIRNANEETGEVESIEIEQTSQEMYNLTVDEAHTFFVGEGQWLVHNTTLCDIRTIQGSDRQAFYQFADDAFAWNMAKRERGLTRGLNAREARASLAFNWFNAFEGPLPGEELYGAFRGEQIVGAVDIIDNMPLSIERIGQPALYFNLFETVGNPAGDAGSQLLKFVYNKSVDKGYAGFIYGQALEAPMAMYSRFGARNVGKYTIFDPSNPAFQRIKGRLGLP
jgi:hypothetical protein